MTTLREKIKEYAEWLETDELERVRYGAMEKRFRDEVRAEFDGQEYATIRFAEALRRILEMTEQDSTDG